MREADTDLRHSLELSYQAVEEAEEGVSEREARRARVLDLVAAQAPASRSGGLWSGTWRWLAAASVACLAVLVGVNVSRTEDSGSRAAGARATTAPAAVVANSGAGAVRGDVRGQADARELATSRPEASAFPGEVQDRVATAQGVPALKAEPAERGATSDGLSAAAGAQKNATSAAPDMVNRMLAFAAAGDTEQVVAILGYGVSVDARLGNGNTALMSSLLSKRYATARVLIERGANLDLRNQDEISARDLLLSSDEADLQEIGKTRPK